MELINITSDVDGGSVTATIMDRFVAFQQAPDLFIQSLDIIKKQRSLNYATSQYYGKSNFLT